MLSLVGHHRETTTLLAGPCRFDGGIERQQVGLLGNRADGLDDALRGGRQIGQTLACPLVGEQHGGIDAAAMGLVKSLQLAEYLRGSTTIP